MRATLCFTNNMGNNLNITATSQSMMKESSLRWDHDKRDYDTESRTEHRSQSFKKYSKTLTISHSLSKDSSHFSTA
jgi:hypothetical protein